MGSFGTPAVARTLAITRVVTLVTKALGVGDAVSTSIGTTPIGKGDNKALALTFTDSGFAKGLARLDGFRTVDLGCPVVVDGVGGGRITETALITTLAPSIRANVYEVCVNQSAPPHERLVPRGLSRVQLERPPPRWVLPRLLVLVSSVLLSGFWLELTLLTFLPWMLLRVNAQSVNCAREKKS